MRSVRWFAIVALSASLVLAQGPVVSDGAVANAASFERGAGAAPGSLVMIFGSQLASSLSRADTVPLSNAISGVSVTFNGVTAPLQFVSENAIQAQVPWNVLPDATVPGTATVLVTSGGITSQPVSVPINPFSPAIYRLSSSSSQAMAFNPDGTVAGPAAGAIAGLQSHPASPGDTITVYANGLGAVTPSIPNGANSSDTARATVITPVVLIQGANAQVTSSGLSAQFPGMNQLSVIVPAGITSSDVAPIQLQVGGITTTTQITIAVIVK